MSNRIAILKKMLQTTPEDPFLLHALGLEYYKTGDISQARYFFESVINVAPDYIGTYYHLAKLYENIDMDKAILIYEKGIKEAKRKKDIHAYNELLAAYEDFTA